MKYGDFDLYMLQYTCFIEDLIKGRRKKKKGHMKEREKEAERKKEITCFIHLAAVACWAVGCIVKCVNN